MFKDMNGDESNVSAKEFVDILKQNPDYKGGNIRLIACEKWVQARELYHNISQMN